MLISWTLLSCTTILSFLGGLSGAYLSSYSKEKAKNLATKEDIGQITKEIELIKNHFSKKNQKSEAYINRQIAALDLVYKEMYRLRMHYFETGRIPITKYDEQDFNDELKNADAIIHLVEEHGMYLTPMAIEQLTFLSNDILELIDYKHSEYEKGESGILLVPEEYFETIETRTKLIQQCLKREVFDE